MIGALIGPLTSLVGTWMESKAEVQRSKQTVAKAEAEARATVMVSAAASEAGWERIMAEASKDSWKDEAYTILFIVIIAMCFIPPLQPFVERGFAALETTPEWFRVCMYCSIGASFGLRGITKFRGSK